MALYNPLLSAFGTFGVAAPSYDYGNYYQPTQPVFPTWPMGPGATSGYQPWNASLNYFMPEMAYGQYAQWNGRGRSQSPGLSNFFGYATLSPDDAERYTWQHSGNLMDFFVHSWGIDGQNYRLNQTPGVYGSMTYANAGGGGGYANAGAAGGTTYAGIAPATPSSPKPLPKIPDVMTRLATYMKYRTPAGLKDVNKVLADIITREQPGAKRTGEGDVSSLIRKWEEKHNKAGRDELLRTCAKTMNDIIGSPDPEVRAKYLAELTRIATDLGLDKLERSYLTEEVAGKVLLAFFGRASRSNNAAMQTMREFLTACHIQVDRDEELAPALVKVFQHYYGAHWADVIWKVTMETANVAARNTDAPDLTDPAVIRGRLEKKGFDTDLDKVALEFLSTYGAKQKSYPNVWEAITELKPLSELKESQDDKLHARYAKRYEAYLTTLFRMAGFTEEDLDPRSGKTIVMEMAPGWKEKPPQQQFHLYVPKRAADLKTYLDKVVARIDEYRLKRRETLADAADPKQQRDWTKAREKLFKKWHKEDAKMK